MINNIVGVVIIVMIFVTLFLVVYFLYKRSVYRATNEKKPIRKFGIFAQYLIVFLIFMIIAITGFLKLNNQKIKNFSSITPFKGLTIAEKNDTCIAFGFVVSHKDLIQSNVLLESDESKLINLQNKYRDKLAYSVYFMKKENVDYVSVSNLYEPYNSFTFSSALPYTFESILLKFEELIGKELTNEFLNGERSGISLHIIKECLNNYYIIIMFKCEIDGVNYIVYYDEELDKLIGFTSL